MLLSLRKKKDIKDVPNSTFFLWDVDHLNNIEGHC